MIDTKKYEIAVVKFYIEEKYEDEYQTLHKIIDSVSNWSLVNEEELKSIRQWCSSQTSHDRYQVIERIEIAKPIPLILEEIKHLAEQKRQETKLRNEKREAEKKKRELKKLAKIEAEEKALLEQLAKKYKKESA